MAAIGTVRIKVQMDTSEVNAQLDELRQRFVRVGEAATEASDRLAEFALRVEVVERCDYSWLYTDQCAHCLGHVLDVEVKV